MRRSQKLKKIYPRILFRSSSSPDGERSKRDNKWLAGNCNWRQRESSVVPLADTNKSSRITLGRFSRFHTITRWISSFSDRDEEESDGKEVKRVCGNGARGRLRLQIGIV